MNIDEIDLQFILSVLERIKVNLLDESSEKKTAFELGYLMTTIEHMIDQENIDDHRITCIGEFPVRYERQKI